MSDLNHQTITSCSKMLPHVAWALANVICFATGSDSSSMDLGMFASCIDHLSYVRVVTILSEDLTSWFATVKWTREENQDIQVNYETSTGSVETLLPENQRSSTSLNISYLDLFRPVCQQWHLMKLLTVGKDLSFHVADNPPQNPESLPKHDLFDIAYFYSYMLRIFSILNPLTGSLPVLNMLSFTPGFLVKLWAALEKSLSPAKAHATDDGDLCSSSISENSKDRVFDKTKKRIAKNGGKKWGHILHKITGKSHRDIDYVESINGESSFNQIDDSFGTAWDIESLEGGPGSLSTDSSCILYLFCAAYSHLLLVLDDIEFYDRQVPFTLEQQQRIAAMLNTLVYNSLSLNISQQISPLMDAAVRCLHLLYERDSRHQFCPPALWLAPARKNRPPIAIAARTHEVLSAMPRSDDSLAVGGMRSVITTTPHIFPFEERYV